MLKCQQHFYYYNLFIGDFFIYIYISGIADEK